MKLKKITSLFLSSLMLTGACLFVTGCGEKSDADNAADAVQDAGTEASDAVQDISQ
jgi:predicted small secreted protein